MTAPAVDYEDMKSGFQAPRAAALADWAFRKEQQEFGVLVNRLRARKWAKDHPERANARSRKWQAAHRAAVQDAQRRRRFKRWVARAGQGIVCADCGVWFCEARPRKGMARRFCSAACRWRLLTRENARRHRAERGAKQRRAHNRRTP
jgi:hypothetical protein